MSHLKYEDRKFFVSLSIQRRKSFWILLETEDCDFARFNDGERTRGTVKCFKLRSLCTRKPSIATFDIFISILRWLFAARSFYERLLRNGRTATAICILQAEKRSRDRSVIARQFAAFLGNRGGDVSQEVAKLFPRRFPRDDIASPVTYAAKNRRGTASIMKACEVKAIVTCTICAILTFISLHCSAHTTLASDRTHHSYFPRCYCGIY